MSEPKKYTISLLAKEYILVSDESQEHISKATSLLNGLMETIAKNTNFTHEKITVLAAIQLASRVVSEEAKVYMCKDKTKSIIDQIDQALYSSGTTSV